MSVDLARIETDAMAVLEAVENDSERAPNDQASDSDDGFDLTNLDLVRKDEP